MGGLAGAAGSIGAAAISAQAQQAMQQQMIDNYWKQIERQAEMDRINYDWRREDYGEDYGIKVRETELARSDLNRERFKNVKLAERNYRDILDQLKQKSTDIYGGLRKYIPGQGFVYKMAPDILDAFRDALRSSKRGQDFANFVQRTELPKAYAEFAGRKKIGPASLFQIYGEDARLADWRARQEMGNRLGLASVRGGNRSNFADNVQDYLREDSKDRKLRMNEARRASIGDSLAFNRQGADDAFSNLSNVLNLSSGGASGERFGQFADAKQSNLSGIEGALMAALGNIGPQMGARDTFGQVRSQTPYPENRVWEIKRPGEMESRPSFSV